MTSEESVDVLSPLGVPTGEVKTKADVHRDGDWHRCAHVWIVRSDGRVLLQRRSASKDNWPRRWDVAVAGHLSAGESASEAAVREAREELGVTIHPDELVHIATTREQRVLNGRRYLDNEFHEVFLVRRDVRPEALRLDPQEVAEVILVPWSEVARYDPVPHPDEYAAVGRFLA